MHDHLSQLSKEYVEKKHSITKINNNSTLQFAKSIMKLDNSTSIIDGNLRFDKDSKLIKEQKDSRKSQQIQEEDTIKKEQKEQIEYKTLDSNFDKTYTIKKRNEDFTISPQIKRGKVLQKEYYITNKLGKGSFGTVYRVTHGRTGLARAMKIIKKDNILLQDDERQFLKEIEILTKTDHMNIIKIFEYFMDDINYYVITEFVQGSELLESLVKIPDFDERMIKKVMTQLMSAVTYLHKEGIAHRDLKPENILVDHSVTSDLSIKVIDFGTSNYVKKNKNLRLKVGSPYYIAPEVLESDYNEKCDIWSCGCILYVLLVGYPPFQGETTEELFSKIKKGDYKMRGEEWDIISDDAKDLVKLMLNKDYKNRISAQDCLNHPFLKENKVLNINSKSFREMKLVMKNLKNFHQQDKLQQATIAYIVHFLTPSHELEKLKNAFSTLDKNKDGTLSLEEIKAGFEQLFGKFVSEVEIQSILSDCDANGDGKISYEEFIQMVVNRGRILNEKNLQLCFEAFDLNKDKKLSSDEIIRALGTNNNEYVKELISLIDTDKNSEIDFEEFKKLMKVLVEREKTGK